MKLAYALIVLTLAGSAVASKPAKPAEPVYPAWLEMKEGYAETCAAAVGGCIPMTQDELKALVMKVHQQTLVMCNRRI